MPIDDSLVKIQVIASIGLSQIPVAILGKKTDW